MDAKKLYSAAGLENLMHDPTAPRLTINLNKVTDSKLVKGLKVYTEEMSDGVRVVMNVLNGVVIEKPVHLCFGVLHEYALQHIRMNVRVGEGAKINIFAHCVFPSSVDVKHIMDAEIVVENGAEYRYLERHIHSPLGGITVIPKARVKLAENARFKTDFELIKGRVGLIDIDYETTVAAGSTMEMTSKISGKGDDIIKIKESAYLLGEHAVGVLNSRIAVRDRARAEIYNVLIADAPYARGHVDCKEIVQDDATAKAVPIVEVKNAKAHVTHEAAIGSVDNKQLETLLSRGLSEDEAVDLIIEGLLS
ncbi:SufD family Fe-S cluster assembly protein [bacterium]|nr:SufD family Fe-S cluster assembly protein [bacterium]